MNENQYDDLIGKIYDAAISPELWPVFLEQLSEALASKGTVLYLVDFANRASTCRSDEIAFIQSVRTDPVALESYDRYYSKVNVWFERSKNLPEARFMTTDRMFPESDLTNTEWYNDWLEPQGYFRAMIGHLLKQDTLTVRLAVFRTKQHAFSAAETAMFARLMPHLRRSCLIHKKLSGLKNEQSANIGLLDRLPLGVVLFDRYGKIVFVNRTADTIGRSANGLSFDTTGRCLTANAKETCRLHQLIGNAVELGQGNVMNVSRRGLARPFLAIVVPLQNRQLPFIESGPSAALFICDLDMPVDLDDGILTQCYGLSPAEAKLAVALLHGQTPGDYAETQGLSNNTVKTQLKQVLSKTGTRRQSEVVQLLTKYAGFLLTK